MLSAGFALARDERRFYFTLADRLGMPVGELLTRMSAEEFIEWRALSNVEAREAEHRRKVAGRKR